MKRLLSLLILLSLLLCGCSGSGKEENTVTFFYLREEYRASHSREEYQYDLPDKVIATEEIVFSSQLTNSIYLFSQYLNGPLDSSLVNPLPEDTEIAYMSWKNRDLEICLRGSFSALTDMELTLARTCVTYTCLEITMASTVSVVTEDPSTGESNSASFQWDSFLLQDATITH